MYSIQQEGKNQFLHDLSRNVTRGKIAGARKGNFQGSTPYGFDREFRDSSGEVVHRARRRSGFTRPLGWTTHLSPSTFGLEVQTVRWIFDEFANRDRSIAGITRELNERGIDAPCAGEWFRNTVRKILSNRHYLGDTVYGKLAAGKFYFALEGGEVARSTSATRETRREGAFIIPATHEPLIDVATWDRAQLKIDGRRRDQIHPREGGYILSGLVRCGHCGRRLVASHTRLRDGRRLGYYRCEADLRFGSRRRPSSGFVPSDGSVACVARCAPRDQIDSFIIDFVKREILSPEAVAKIERDRRALIDEAKAADEPTALRRQISQLDGEISRGAANLLKAAPEAISAASDLLVDWKKKREQLNRRLRRSIDRQNETESTATDGAIRHRLSAALDSGDCRAVRTALKTVLNEVRVFWAPYGAPKLGGEYRKYRVARIEPVVRLHD